MLISDMEVEPQAPELTAANILMQLKNANNFGPATPASSMYSPQPLDLRRDSLLETMASDGRRVLVEQLPEEYGGNYPIPESSNGSPASAVMLKYLDDLENTKQEPVEDAPPDPLFVDEHSNKPSLAKSAGGRSGISSGSEDKSDKTGPSRNRKASSPKKVNQPKGKMHRCNFPGCAKVYGKSSHLKAHLRTHTGRFQRRHGAEREESH